MAKTRKIILASTSQGRKELMGQTGLKFSIEPSDYVEDMSLRVSPTSLVKILSKGKARAVASKHNNAIVIGADSVAVLNGKPLGKPQDNKDAKKMLRALSGRKHVFTTGLTVIDTKSGKEKTEVVKTNVYFRKLTNSEIESYVASGQSTGHAGAYAIQGKGGMLVEKIEGEYTNIIGLPLARLTTTLKTFGVNPLVYS